MGEVSRHADLFRNNFLEFLQVRGLEEDYIYLELGNFLTDVSQFVDPYAFVSAKKVVLGSGAKQVIVIQKMVGLDKWADELLGSYDRKIRPGKLAEYFEQIFKGATHAFFGKKSQLAAHFLQRCTGDPIDRTIPAEEIDEFLQVSYTQYYPHEHLDMPPPSLGRSERNNPLDLRARPTSSDSSMVQGSVRRYLHLHLQYLAEELSLLEKAWVQAKREPSKARHKLMGKLGHLVHGVEDFFFHSNFAEIRLYNVFARANPQLKGDALMEAFLQRGLEAHRQSKHTVEGYRNPTSHAHWMRKIFRRLLYPQFELMGNAAHSKTKSLSSLSLVYTGGFEGDDMYHTIIGALEGFAEVVLQGIGGAVPPGLGAIASQLPIFHAVGSADERRRLGDEKVWEQRTALHVEKMRSGAYQAFLMELVNRGLINLEAYRYLERAFAIDLALDDKYKLPPGVGGFMLKLLADAQASWDANEKAAAIVTAIDPIGTSTVQGMRNPGSDNTPRQRPASVKKEFWRLSDEYVGTHSLMSKDTKASQPLFEDAVALGSFASQAIVKTFMEAIERNEDPRTGVDWRVVLAHFVKYPRGVPTDWEQRVIAHFLAQGTYLSYPMDGQAPQWPVYSEAQNAEFRNFRQQANKRLELEKFYKDLEATDSEG